MTKEIKFGRIYELVGEGFKSMNYIIPIKWHGTPEREQIVVIDVVDNETLHLTEKMFCKYYKLIKWRRTDKK